MKIKHICQNPKCPNGINGHPREFEVTSSIIKKGGGKYCCRKCFTIVQNKKVKCVCQYPECHLGKNGKQKEFYIPKAWVKKGDGKYCCNDHKHKDMTKRFSGENSPSYKGGLPHCVDCGIEISRGHTRCKKCSCKQKGLLLRKPRIERICQYPECNLGKNGGPKIFEIPIYEVKYLLNGRGTYCCKKHKNLDNARRFSGKDNPNWNEGSSYVPYSHEFNEKTKEEIRDRDGRKCQFPECNKTEEQELNEMEQKLTIHHINYNKKDCRKENLLTLCSKHHGVVNAHRKDWQIYFETIMIKRARVQGQKEGFVIGYIKGRIDQKQLNLFNTGG